MESREHKPTLTLRKNIPAPLSAPTSNVELTTPNPLADITEFTHELISALESSDIDDDCGYSTSETKYYSERKKVRGDKRTHRKNPTRKQSRWQ
jgi:hypothetical protein